MLTELRYDRVWCVDFEFRAGPGEVPKPICMVATDAKSGEMTRLWEDELEGRFGDPPFDTGPRSLFCAYYAAAEWGCFQALGWPRPANMIDLYAEFRVASNGTFVPFGRGLLGALEWFGLPLGSTKDTKNAMRQRVLAGPPWKPGEREQIIEYCASDVRPLPGLLVALLPGIHRVSRKGWDHALLRGQYTWEVAAIERHGLPIDEERFGRLVDRWDDIRVRLVGEVDQEYGVYEGTTFKPGLFLGWLHRERIFEWPRTQATGRLQLDADTFRDMARAHPKLWPLHRSGSR